MAIGKHIKKFEGDPWNFIEGLFSPKSDAKVILAMSEEEAQVLCAVLGHVGGNPKDTRRGLVDNIADALAEAGFPWTPSEGETEGVVRFKPVAVEQVWERTTPHTLTVEVLAVDDEEARAKLAQGDYNARHNSSGEMEDWERVS